MYAAAGLPADGAQATSTPPNTVRLTAIAITIITIPGPARPQVSAQLDGQHAAHVVTLGRCALVGDDAAIHQGDLSADDRADVAFVGDHHDGPPVGVQLGEQLQHGVGGGRVEVAGRLVGQQQRRIVGQRPGDRGALLLPARERGGQLVGLVGDADRSSSCWRAVAPLAGRDLLGEVHRQHHVLGHGQRRQQLEELEHQPDVAAPPGSQPGLRQRPQIGAGGPDGPRGGPVDPGEQVQQRRLAAARAPDDRDELALGDVEAEVVDGDELAGCQRVGLDDVADLDRVVHGGCLRRESIRSPPPAAPAGVGRVGRCGVGSSAVGYDLSASNGGTWTR